MCPETNVAAARTVTIELRDSTTNPTYIEARQYSTQRLPIARMPPAQQLVNDCFEAVTTKTNAAYRTTAKDKKTYLLRARRAKATNK